MSHKSSVDTWYASWFNTPYYHILYKDRDYDEAQSFMETLTSHLNLPQDSHILDLACGRGRHSIYLNKLGFTVTGADLSDESIAFAKAKTTNIPYIDFKVHNMTIPMDEQYDAVFNLFTSFGYFDDDTDNQKTIHAIASNLKEGAYGVIDFMNVNQVIDNLVAADVKTEGGIEFTQQRSYVNGFIEKTITFIDSGRDFEYMERVKALNLTDFKAYLAKAGLELISTHGDYALGEFNAKRSKRLILIFKK